MATPPTRVQSVATVYNTAASKTTSSFSVLAGDILTARAIAESNGATFTISGGSLTWALQQNVNITDYCEASVWTATVDVDKSMTVTVDDTGPPDFFFGARVTTWRGSDGVGASAKTNVASGAPSLALTTQADNSAIDLGVGDWAAVDGASRTWRSVNGSAATEEDYFRDSARYTLYQGYHPDAGAAGSKTVGLSAPSGQKYAIVAVEIKGAAAAATSLPFLRRFPMSILQH